MTILMQANEIQISVAGLDDALKTLDVKGARIIVIRTLNRLARLATTQVKAEIISKYNLKKSQLNIKPYLANPNSGSNDVGVRALGRPQPLSLFKPRQTPDGVIANFKKDRPTVIDNAFIYRTKYGNLKVALRDADGLKQQYRASLPDIVGGDTIREVVETSVNKNAESAFDAEWNYYILQQSGNKGSEIFKRLGF